MKRNLNLLPWRLRRDLVLRTRLRQWRTAWAVLAVVGLASYGWSWRCYMAAHQELELWKRRAAGIQLVNDRNDALRRQVAALRERSIKYGHIDSEQVGYQLLATISQSSAMTSGNNQIQKLTFKQTQVVEQPVAGAATAEPKIKDVRTLTLNGVANNNLTIAQFVSSLRDSGAFRTVDLKSSFGNKLTSLESRLYQVECSF